MQPTLMRGRVLSIAGSDSGGGAGIQADIKTITALGAYASTAITAITVQNTLGVHGVDAISAAVISAQINSVLNDIGADAIKTGMLSTGTVIESVASELKHWPQVPLVVDPVMVAKGGASLLASEAVDALRTLLLPLATIITPNLPEAEVLIDKSISTRNEMMDAARLIRALGAKAVLVKGGHLAGDDIFDVYLGPEGTHEWHSTRVATRHTHGTGCTLSSAIATGLAQGMSSIDSITRARDYVLVAIQTAPRLGSGHGPLNHAHTIRPLKEES
ncbi:MAG: bifunctional hydroxymethylpyrimidine kinase/phosphomethylpyrimidine kinase [Micropepsaceae bacterium]